MKSYFAAAASLFALIALSQAEVPTDLSRAFSGSSLGLQLSFGGDASEGLADGAAVSMQDASRPPTFALSDASGVNTAQSFMIMMIDTTEPEARRLHYLQCNFKPSGEKTKLESSTKPAMEYRAPGSLGETGKRQYTFLMYLRRGGGIMVEVPAPGEPFDVRRFEEANRLAGARTGIAITVDIDLGQGGRGEGERPEGGRPEGGRPEGGRPGGEGGERGRPGAEGGEGKPGEGGRPGAEGGERGRPGAEGGEGKPGEGGRPGAEGGERGRPGAEGGEGKPGEAGRPGAEGGERGRPGAEGGEGKPGEAGRPGAEGGERGRPGAEGGEGKPGEAGRPGAEGGERKPGEGGRPGAEGGEGKPGEAGRPGAEGGERGRPGAEGGEGKPGEGKPGEAGRPGGEGGRPAGQPGEGERGQGERGSVGTGNSRTLTRSPSMPTRPPAAEGPARTQSSVLNVRPGESSRATSNANAAVETSQTSGTERLGSGSIMSSLLLGSIGLGVVMGL